MKYFLSLLYSSIITFLSLFFLKKLYISTEVIIPYTLTPYDICYSNPTLWNNLKILYPFICFFSHYLLSFRFLKRFFILKNNINPLQPIDSASKNVLSNNLSLLLGKSDNSPVYLEGNSLFQNILITGTIGTGKTSSAMYPITRQLIEFPEKMGMLILDVKGNYYDEVKSYAQKVNREKDLIVIDLSSNIKYNPLDKKNLKPSILANRLKTILTLFATNHSDSFWLDKVEAFLNEAIKYCRLYNNRYVTFLEIHQLVTNSNYYKTKIPILRDLLQKASFSAHDLYDLKTSLDFFDQEISSLDPRTLSIIQAEITRITSTFISDYDVISTFCPNKDEITFSGFKEVLESGKIVVLHMNIAEYQNLSKIIAAYLKLDFQTEVLLRLSKQTSITPCAFICDEYSEYVTETDANFFSQSREAKCINVIATQSYTSLLGTLKNKATVKIILQSLVNKLWFRNDDLFTIEEAQKQIRKN